MPTRRHVRFSRRSGGKPPSDGIETERWTMDILIAAALAFAAFVYAAVPDNTPPSPSEPTEDAQPLSHDEG